MWKKPLVLIDDFNPTMSEPVTTEAAAKAVQATLGVPYEGPGWYVAQDGRTLLIAPNVRADLPWMQHPQTDNLRYWYFRRPPFDALNSLVNAPTRQDRRS